MYNKGSWTDKDLTIPREEWGKEIMELKNSSPSYYNSEHYYNENGNIPVSYAPSNQPSHKSSEHYYNENGNIPVSCAPSNEPGYKSSEHYYNEGIVASIAYNIDGKSVCDAIENGLLTKENITPEQKEIVCKDILCGVTRNKNILASKLDLILEDKRLIESILLIQYREAIKEISSEKRNKVSADVVNRKYQFLVTTKILMEKGYELDELSFSLDGSKDFIEMLSNFRSQSIGSSAIDDASWFKDGVAPEGYDFRKVKSSFLFSGSLLGELYKKNPDVFKEKYECYKNNTRLEPVSFEEFMERYGISEGLVNEVEFSGKNM